MAKTKENTRTCVDFVDITDPAKPRRYGWNLSEFETGSHLQQMGCVDTGEKTKDGQTIYSMSAHWNKAYHHRRIHVTKPFVVRYCESCGRRL